MLLVRQIDLVGTERVIGQRRAAEGERARIGDGRIEGAAQRAGRGQDGNGRRGVIADMQRKLHRGAAEARCAGDIGEACRRLIEIDDIERARLEREITRDGHRGAGHVRRAGRKSSAAGNRHGIWIDRAVTGQSGAGVDVDGG